MAAEDVVLPTTLSMVNFLKEVMSIIAEDEPDINVRIPLTGGVMKTSCVEILYLML